MNTSVLNSILALGFPPLVTETALGLLDAWASRFAETDSRQTTLLVETPFVIELDEHALVVGIADRIAWSEEAQTIFDCSWKTTREPDARGWHSETKWLAEQKRSVQWMIESIAVAGGMWVTNGSAYRFNVSPPPPVIIRAAVKSAIPDFWPTDVGDGVWRVNETQGPAVLASFRNKVAEIRALRRTGLLPWQMTGNQCFTYNQRCEFLGDCEKNDYAGAAYAGPKNKHDETIKTAITVAAPGFGTHADDVLLTPTNYILASSCMERWRRRLTFPTRSTPAQEIGTAFHAGLAAWYTNEMPLVTDEERNRWLTKIK